jgi:hypothetical protein
LGVPEERISYVIAEKEEGAEENKKTAAGKGAGAGAVIGGVAGAVLASGIIPGLGALFVAGPLASALGLTGTAAAAVSGAATGIAAGGLIGAFTGMGVSPEDAKRYEQRIKRGDLVVAVDAHEKDLKTILEKRGAEEIREYESES